MFDKIGKIWILVNVSFSKIGKFSDVPALKHILKDPELVFFSLAVYYTNFN